ncbi:MAG: hypothetical protein R3E90_02695 [Marinicella sp.]
MKKFDNNNFYSISELNKALDNNSVGIFAKSIKNYIHFDGLVTLVKSDIDNLEAVEADFNDNIINDLSVSNLLSNPTKFNHQQTFNFKGFFEFVHSDNRSLCLYPTEYCLIDGLKPELNEGFYFPTDLNNIMMALDRKLMGDTPITHAELYTWNIRSEFKKPMFYILSIYFLESEIIDFAAKKSMNIQTLAEIEKAEAMTPSKARSGVGGQRYYSISPNHHNINSSIAAQPISPKNEKTQTRTFLDSAIDLLEPSNKSPYYKIYQNILLLVKENEPHYDKDIKPKIFMSLLEKYYRKSTKIHAVSDGNVTFNFVTEKNGVRSRDDAKSVRLVRVQGNFSKFRKEVLKKMNQ